MTTRPGAPASLVPSAHPPPPSPSSSPFAPHVVPSSGHDGQSVVITVRVDPEVKRDIDVKTHLGLATGCYPWETPSDMVRWLLKTGLRLLDQAVDQDGMGSAYRAALSHVDDVQAQIRQARRLHEQIHSAMTELVDMGQSQAAVTFLHAQVDRITDMPTSAARDWLLGTVQQEYEAFLGRDPAPASLVNRSRRGITKAAKANVKAKGRARSTVRSFPPRKA